MTQKENKTSILSFHGAAGSVTGANFLLDTGARKILIDCGMEQGGARTMNAQAQFPYDPKDIDILIVTHAHADHIGRIPLLIKKGFNGVIYSTPATKDLSAVMLEDALKILTKEARDSGRMPLYNAHDIQRALSLWRTQSYHKKFDLGDDVRCQFFDAGHVLGSLFAQFKREERSIVFSGDLGNTPAKLLADTEQLPPTHYLLIESVYGNRNHQNRGERTKELVRVINDVIKRKGTLLIPSFALQRTQVLLYELNNMIEDGLIPKIPVYLDAPLGTRVTEIFRRYISLFKKNVRDEIAAGDDIFNFPGFTIVDNVRQSHAIKNGVGPKIIIASSGMSVGGRVLLHEKSVLGNKNNTILFVGYQAIGSLGRAIQEGAHKKINIDGKYVRIRAHIETINGYSGHKDSDHLIAFIGQSARTLEHVFVAMGEPESAAYLAGKIHETYSITANAPKEGDAKELHF